MNLHEEKGTLIIILKKCDFVICNFIISVSSRYDVNYPLCKLPMLPYLYTVYRNTLPGRNEK